jgi:hypothetical protein
MAFGDRLETVEQLSIQDKISPCGRDLNTVHLTIKMRVLLELHYGEPVSGVLDSPAVR